MVSVSVTTPKSRRRAQRALVPAAVALLCGACAQTSADLSATPLAETASAAPVGEITTSALPPANSSPAPAVAAAREITVAPETAKAIRVARTAREKGQKTEALAGLDKAKNADSDPALLSERGMLALELGQTKRAEELLKSATSKGADDWRVLSAYGAALSANGNQSAAQAELAKALAAAPGQPAVLNNLALSYALDGKHAEAERLLRQATDTGGNPQAGQNLALILGLNGKVGEARAIAERHMPAETARENMAYFERLGSGRTTMSRAELPADLGSSIRSASYAGADTSTEPIMRLTTPE